MDAGLMRGAAKPCASPPLQRATRRWTKRRRHSAARDYLKTAWDDSVLQARHHDFVRTFISHGVNAYSAAYPYESVYTSERHLMVQEARQVLNCARTV